VFSGQTHIELRHCLGPFFGDLTVNFSLTKNLLSVLQNRA
jgi:hypothetical protein